MSRISENTIRNFKLLLVFGIFFLYACKPTVEQKDNDDIKVSGDTIIIKSTAQLNGKLKLGKVQPHSYRLQISSAATVKAIPNKYAQIAPPFSGRLLKSYVRLGQHVDENAPLFELISPSFIDAQKLFFQAKSQYKLSEQNLKRQKDLLANGVGVVKDLEEAESNFEVQKKEYENAFAGMRIFAADPEVLVLGQPLVVRSPIKGEVIVNNIVV
ncbi:MAG: efflux RND transporter periplasmic adaptor subunit, partial [Cytophagales bacterium]|nr:efflux RND transporter periplasmic adaptor subunit [Cytophagales bacterium]